MQALVDDDGVLQVQARLQLDLDLDTGVLKRNDLEDIADDHAEVAPEAETANQNLILLIIDAMQT